MDKIKIAKLNIHSQLTTAVDVGYKFRNAIANVMRDVQKWADDKIEELVALHIPQYNEMVVNAKTNNDLAELLKELLLPYRFVLEYSSKELTYRLKLFKSHELVDTRLFIITMKGFEPKLEASEAEKRKANRYYQELEGLRDSIHNWAITSTSPINDIPYKFHIIVNRDYFDTEDLLNSDLGADNIIVVNKEQYLNFQLEVFGNEIEDKSNHVIVRTSANKEVIQKYKEYMYENIKK